MNYARRFAIEKHLGYRLVYLFGEQNPLDTSFIYLLYDSVDPGIRRNNKVFRIHVPCKKIAALSSIYANTISELGAINRLSAIDDINYTNNAEIIEKSRQGGIRELSKGPEPDIEQLLLLKPDMLFTYGMGNPKSEINSKILNSGIPVAVCVDHLEETPLARAEWIKFFAVFTGTEKKADSIFNTSATRYIRLKDSVANSQKKPLVLTEVKYGETWYVPGGKSFMARLIQDAGGDYSWKDDQHAGSLALSFEQVYLKAGRADYWIHLSTFKNKKELLASEERYAEFEACKKGNLYNNNKRTNTLGYSDYWESAMIHPDRILSDLIQIFHNKTVSDSELYYYKKLQ